MIYTTSREEKLEKQRFWRVNGHHVVLDSKVSVVVISLMEKGSRLSPALIQLVMSGHIIHAPTSSVPSNVYFIRSFVSRGRWK